MKRLEVVRDVIGADKEMMVDVNRGWDLATATEAAGLLETFKPPLSARGARQMDRRSPRTETIVATDAAFRLPGRRRERTHEPWLPRAVGGTRRSDPADSIARCSEGLHGGSHRLAGVVRTKPRCRWLRITISFIHAPLVASTPDAGCIVESFTDPERDPLRGRIVRRDPPRIAGGWLTLSDAPGLGLTLSAAALKKYGERIL